MKISFFVGRAHHYDKMRSVVAALKDHDVSLIVADNAINIDPPGDYRGHVVYHLGNWLPANFSYTDNDVVPIEGVSPYWSVFSSLELQRVITSAERLFEATKPDILVVLHMDNFWASALSSVAKKHSVKIVSMQEGIMLQSEKAIGKYSLAETLSDVILCWSHLDVERYYPDSSKAIAIGPSHLDAFINKKNVYLGKRDVLFAPPRADLYRGDIIKAINEAIKLNPLFKFHPFDRGYDDYIINRLHGRVVSGDAPSIVSMSSAVLTQVTTIAIEAIALMIPLYYIDLDYEGIPDSLPGVPYWDGGELVGHCDVGLLKQAIIPLADGHSTQRAVRGILA